MAAIFNRRSLMQTLSAVSVMAAMPAFPAAANECKFTPKQVVTQFIDELYIRKNARLAYETWVHPDYIQHDPEALSGREAAILFLEKFIAEHQGMHTDIRRVIADGDLVAVHSHGWLKDGDPGFAVVDIFRVEGCQIMEHWDVIQLVPTTSANSNGMF